MSINITMPALSPTMEEGNLAKWLVKEGDAVSPGDVIAEIETDKATMEVEAVDEGTMAKILVPAGTENVPVNEVIAVLAEDGEDASDVDASAPSQPAEVPKADPDAQRTPEAKTEPSPPAERKEHGKPHVSSKPQRAEKTSPPKKSGGGGEGERIFASPLARRIAAQNDLAIENISGSGPHGRIVKADVEKAIEDGSAKAAPVAQETAPHTPTAKPAPASAIPDEAILKLYEEGNYEKKPHDGMRRTIAERLSQSSQTVPSYFISMDCEIDALLALRKQVNDAAPKDQEGKPGYKVSVNDFIVKAMAMALMRVPAANASWTSTDRIYHKHADIGVAVSVEDGLFTPIVRRAEEKTLSVISTEIRDMAGRAKTKKLKPEEYQGGSTAVSNMGMYGVKEFTSIINPPHASIVSIGVGEKRAVVKGDALAIASVMTATFAFDHRVIDGALGAELAAAFKNLVENPMGMLV